MAAAANWEVDGTRLLSAAEGFSKRWYNSPGSFLVRCVLGAYHRPAPEETAGNRYGKVPVLPEFTSRDITV